MPQTAGIPIKSRTKSCRGKISANFGSILFLVCESRLFIYGINKRTKTKTGKRYKRQDFKPKIADFC